MNVSSETQGKGRRRDFDINLAPIIDCFTVLIAFMLVSASFLAIGVFEASSGAATAAPDNSTNPPPAITIEIALGLQKELVVKISGKEKSERTLPPVKDDWNFPELVAQVEAVRKRWPDTRTAVITPKDAVSYIHLIRAMETLKPILPGVLLGGF